jgi:hypothetical protein
MDFSGPLSRASYRDLMGRPRFAGGIERLTPVALIRLFRKRRIACCGLPASRLSCHDSNAGRAVRHPGIPR